MQTYLEPFCGACNVTALVRAKRRIASDLHPDLIMMWDAVQHGKLSFPQAISLQEYKRLSEEPPSALRGFVGFAQGFGGKFFGTFSRGRRGSGDEQSLIYLNRGAGVIRSKALAMATVEFKYCSYLDWHPKNWVVYCDPPYQDVAGYTLGDFDHDQFWETMRTWSTSNKVFISEYRAPEDFKSIWSQDVCQTVSSNSDKRRYVTEHLFVHA